MKDFRHFRIENYYSDFLDEVWKYAEEHFSPEYGVVSLSFIPASKEAAICCDVEKHESVTFTRNFGKPPREMRGSKGDEFSLIRHRPKAEYSVQLDKNTDSGSRIFAHIVIDIIYPEVAWNEDFHDYVKNMFNKWAKRLDLSIHYF